MGAPLTHPPRQQYHPPGKERLAPGDPLAWPDIAWGAVKAIIMTSENITDLSLSKADGLRPKLIRVVTQW